MKRVNFAVRGMTKSPNPVKISAVGSKNDSDIVIVATCRTAITKARKGGFKDTDAIGLLAPCLKELLKRTGVDPKSVSDIRVGTVLAPGSLRATECRMAAFQAGFPKETSVCTVNRQCSSSLQAIADVAASITAGYYEIGIGAGVESMSSNSMSAKGFKISDETKKSPESMQCLFPMIVTSDNVAKRYKVSREDQDRVAVRSHQRAAKGVKKLMEEIVPVEVSWKNPKTGKWELKLVNKDGGIRYNANLQSMSKLRSIYPGGTTSAANASQVSDGGAATMLMKRSKAKELGLPIIAVVRSFGVVGVDPSVMGIGPAYAIPAALKKVGLRTQDIDLYEINEAFASQSLWSVNKLGLSWDNVNVNGGAIALGHPLGMTGARMTTTLIYEMRRRKAKTGVVSMCIGTGMGAAMVYEVEY